LAIFKPTSRKAARLELNIDPRAVVVFIGRLVPLKGLRKLFEAAATLTTFRSTLLIVFIGEGPMDQELRQRASQPDLKSHVSFAVGPSPPEIARWLAASNVFCLPSHSEGCPNVVIEAVACGRPVGIPELLNARCGILVPSGNAQQPPEDSRERLITRGIRKKLRSTLSGVGMKWLRNISGLQVCCSVVGDPKFVRI
jgi:teichuronic acid biosynthesis glycosyltransferase TuaC